MKTQRTVLRAVILALVLSVVAVVQVGAYAAPSDSVPTLGSEGLSTPSAQIDTIMSGAWLVEHLDSGATVDIAGIVADAYYGAVDQGGYAVWERPLSGFRGHGGALPTLGVTIRYAISPDGHFYVGSVGPPAQSLAVLAGYAEWLARDLSLRDIWLYGMLRGAYNRLAYDGHVQGGDGLAGPVDIRNNYGETIQVLYSAVMMFTTYNSEYRYADRLEVWDPSGPGPTSYTGSTWRRLNLNCSENTHTLAYSHVYNDNANSTYVKHDGATVASRGGSIGFNDHIRFGSCPGSVELGGYRRWSEIDSSLHVAVVGGSISSSNYAEYPTNGGNPAPSVLVIPPSNAPPDCSAAAPNINTLWPPNHEFVPVEVLGVTDPEGDAITITIDSIFQDEPVDANGDGSFIPDGEGIGTSTAEVRAERDGGGNGRFYHISFTADDGQGGTCTGKVLVGVPKSQGKKGAPIDDGALYDSTVP